MKGGKTPLGYTIIEVLIVLAASGLMFLIAGNFINGKQAKTAFSTGVNELASQVQDTISQVTDGQYSDVPLDCNVTGSGPNVVAGTGGQGSNLNCIFLGKLLHFSVAGEPTDYEVLSIAGQRLVGGVPVTSISQAKPSLIEDLTVYQKIPQNLEINGPIKITNLDGSAGSPTSYSFGFLQNLGPTTAGGAVTDKGAQSPPSLYYVDSVGAAMGHGNAFDAQIKNPSKLKVIRGVEMCVTDGTRYAIISVGGNSSQQNVTVTMRGNNPC